MKKTPLFRSVSLITSAFYIGKHIWYFLHNPQFNLYWDAPGHIQKALISSWPWSGGWDTTFWGGYPTITYPSFAHLLLKGAIILFHDQRISLAVVVIGASCAVCHGLYRWINQLNIHNTLKSWVFVGVILLISLVPPSILGGLQSNTVTGSLAATVALPLFIYLLSSSSWIARGFWLGLLFQTHVLTASAGMLWYFIEAFGKRSELKKVFYGLLVSLCIGLSAILPLLDPSFGHVAINIGSTPTLGLIFIIVFILSVLIYTHSWSSIAVTGICFAVVASVPQSTMQFIQQLGFHGIHAYRYLIFALICLPISIVQLNRHTKYFTVSLPMPLQYVLWGITLIGLACISIPSTALRINLDTQSINNTEGRIIDATAPENYYLFPHALQHEVLKTTKLIGADGLFYESSGHAPELYSFKTALNPRTFIAGAPTSFFQSTGQSIEQNATASAGLLGVNYMIINGNQPLASPSSTIIPLGTITNTKTKTVQDYLYVVKLTDSPLVEALTEKPTIDPTIDLGTWWTSTDHHQLFVKQPLPNTPTTTSTINNITYDQTHISFTVNSQANVPIYIKFTYSPYWIASGSSSQPQWITPGYMYLEGHGRIVLTWKTPRYVIQSSIISTATLLGTIIILIVKQKPCQMTG